MKRHLSVIATLALLYFGAACVPQGTNTSETDEKEGNTETSKAPSVTVGADSISAISAVLKGKANLTNSAASDLQVGFQYSKSAGILPSNSITIEADDSDANYNYSSCVTGLDPETTYYFRSIVRQKGVDSYGETLSFTTKDATSLLETLDATQVEATTATLNAKLDLTDVFYTKIDYGFYWGDSEQELNNKIGGGEITDKSFSATMNDLPHKTQYWYKAYVKLDEQSFYGEVKTFSTSVVHVESLMLNKSEYEFHSIGDSLLLKAIVYPIDATDTSVIWSSDKNDVVTIDQTGKVKTIGYGKAIVSATTLDQNKTAMCTISVDQWVTEISFEKESLPLIVGESTLVMAIIGPSNATNKALIWSSSDESVATVNENGVVTPRKRGKSVITATAKDGSGINAHYCVLVRNPKPEGAVDLGLSVHWSSYNLDSDGLADSEDSYGAFYTWGGCNRIGDKNWYSGCAWYKCGKYESEIEFSKYFRNDYWGVADNKTTLDLTDDAAFSKLGGTWRIPTMIECVELLENCSCKWVRMPNGHTGLLLTSTVDGFSGNNIFLPAAGVKRSITSAYVTSYEGENEHASYWSSTLGDTDDRQAWSILVKYQNEMVDIRTSYRSNGYSIRPVAE